MVIRRLMSAILLALLVSGAFTLLLARRLTKPNAPSAEVRYTTTNRDVDAGEILQAGDVTEVKWPASQPLDGAVVSTSDALGRAVLSPLAKGQPLLMRQLSAPGGFGLAAKIPSGMRAISLRSDQIVGVAGFLLPGTHIDVLVTYRALGTTDPVTATVLQNAELLATGQKTQPDPDGKPATTDVVTLLVTPLDAERLVLASSQGTLHFVLRNGSDREQGSPRPINVANLGLMQPTHAADVERGTGAKRHVKIGINHPAIAPYSVLVIRGDKQTVETF